MLIVSKFEAGIELLVPTNFEIVRYVVGASVYRAIEDLVSSYLLDMIFSLIY